MIEADISNATHVKVGGTMHKIVSKYGIDENGRLAKPSMGGFGVVVEGGERIDMFTADSYWRESSSATVKIFTVADVPEALAQKWLQHLRDFDAAHPGCHFQVAADAPDMPMAKIIEMLQINPGLDFQAVFERKP